VSAQKALEGVSLFMEVIYLINALSYGGENWDFNLSRQKPFIAQFIKVCHPGDFVTALFSIYVSAEL
jgi:hypothetical protein